MSPPFGGASKRPADATGWASRLMAQVRKGMAAASTRSSSTIPTASPSTSPPTAGRAEAKTSAVKRAGALLALAAVWLAIAFDVLYGGPISDLDVWLAERVQAPRRS